MADMGTLTFVRNGLRACSWADLRSLAAQVEVSHFTLLRIRDGSTPNPGFVTVDRLREHFERKAAEGQAPEAA